MIEYRIAHEDLRKNLLDGIIEGTLSCLAPVGYESWIKAGPRRRRKLRAAFKHKIIRILPNSYYGEFMP